MTCTHGAVIGATYGMVLMSVVCIVDAGWVYAGAPTGAPLRRSALAHFDTQVHHRYKFP